jgi:MraZ protein
VPRGSAPAKIDDKGRLKVPSAFRAFLEKNGPELYVTSLAGDCVLVYPMTVWAERERRLAAVPSMLPEKADYLMRVSYYGAEAELDKQGRVLIQPLLRESAQTTAEVIVLGLEDHLEVWNHERFKAALDGAPMTRERLGVLAQYGI